ncbi:MAG: hypothetical protein ACC658_14990 [Acidimicrobiia bacterium]
MSGFSTAFWRDHGWSGQPGTGPGRQQEVFKRRVSQVAVSAWTYSKTKAEAAEKPFHEMEGDCPGLAERATTPSAIGRRDQLSCPTEVSLAYVLVTVLG